MNSTELNESDYVEQLHRGVGWLRFEGELEPGFRRFYRRFCLTHVRFGLGITLPLLALNGLLNSEVYVPDGPALILNLLTLLVSFLGLGGLLLHFSFDREGRRLPELMAGAMIAGAGLHLLTRCKFAEQGLHYPYSTESYATLLIFLLSGLRFLPALLIALVWLAQALLFQWMYPQDTPELAQMAYNLTAIGLLAAGAGYAQEYLARVNYLLAKMSHHRSEHDALTGVLNRRGFNERFEELLRQARREQKPLALMLIDVDHFKHYNDRYGHPEGDRALTAVAQSLRRHAARRGFDFAARLGGEEFAVVWYNVEAGAAGKLAESTRARIEKLGIAHADSPGGTLTISAGCLSLTVTADTQREQLLEAADEALYEAKRGGRNQVRLARWSGPVLSAGTA
ncbi:GGDEF domain-containing protein [Stagnimonas aquatica]|uniref:diguanylate cyclase n=1 Tax=Stagnimonas aquatica TaxID=2689987 RepID=A0A3N0VGG1_9GAMM|nr:GGDEF domain-containing protein [Stagnimonas aquatica]ROH91873.1 GGDEF domain-containing protein [Stagnimonas aquatica]